MLQSWCCLRRSLAFMVIVLAVGCATQRAAPSAGESAGDAASAAPRYAITLYRSPCYAGCPVYSLSVTPDGLVTYDGTDRVRLRGTATARIPGALVDALLRELEAAGYFDFATRYRPSERVCGRYVPDAPSVITSARLGRRTQRVEHDYGCGSAPLALRVLESRIDEVLGSGRWTGR